MCSTDVMGNYTSREDLRATVAKALEHNVRISDGMNWNLQDLVYEALSEEWRKRDGEDDDPWEAQPPHSQPTPSRKASRPTPSASNTGQERSSRIGGPSQDGAALAPLG